MSKVIIEIDVQNFVEGCWQAETILTIKDADKKIHASVDGITHDDALKNAIMLLGYYCLDLFA